MFQGILYLIESKNPPVFDTPMVIRFGHVPTIGQAFFFNDGWHLSTVQAIKYQDGYNVITTLNSKYILYPIPLEAI